MIPEAQRTLKSVAVVQGYGVHTGERSTIRLYPAKENTGVVFKSSRGLIGADLFVLGSSKSNTCLKSDGFYIETVEHLLGCLYGMFIDNVIVELYGPELPIGDGSAGIFYEVLQNAGIEEQNKSRSYLHLARPILIEQPMNRRISITPDFMYEIHCGLTWHPRIIGEYTYIHGETDFSEIAYARTFASKDYVDALRRERRGLASRAGENYIDIDNGETRLDNEFVKHKVLDILGDLSLLCGVYLKASVVALNSGHGLHHQLMREIYSGSRECIHTRDCHDWKECFN